MESITLKEAQLHLAEIVRALPLGGQMLITENDRPVARLASVAASPSLVDLKPNLIGAILRPFPSDDDDLLGEMIHASK